MTSTHGSGRGRTCSPSSSGFSCSTTVNSPPSDRVPAELVAQRRVHLRGERLLLARGEPRVERGRDHRHGHVLVDRLEDRPAPLARVLDVALDPLELRALLLEGRVQQVEQPRAHDRAVAPDPGDLLEVEVELGGPHHLEALGVGLHQAVLDPVVDHLHEVARAGGADVRVAVFGRERRGRPARAGTRARRRRRPSGSSRPRAPRPRRRHPRRRSGCPSPSPRRGAVASRGSSSCRRRRSCRRARRARAAPGRRPR